MKVEERPSPAFISHNVQCNRNNQCHIRSARFLLGAGAVLFESSPTLCEAASARMPGETPHRSPITASYADPEQLGSRAAFRLLSRAWPFIKPYRRDIIRLFIMLLPGGTAGLFGLVLVRIFFDAIGNGQPLTAYDRFSPRQRGWVLSGSVANHRYRPVLALKFWCLEQLRQSLPAIYDDSLTGNESGLLRGQECHRVSDLVHRTQSPQWDSGGHLKI